MGRDIVALEVRIENVTIFLGVGALSQPGILQKGTLGDQDIFADPGPGFDDRVPVERGTGWDRNRRRNVDEIKNRLDAMTSSQTPKE